MEKLRVNERQIVANIHVFTFWTTPTICYYDGKKLILTSWQNLALVDEVFLVFTYIQYVYVRKPKC